MYGQLESELQGQFDNTVLLTAFRYKMDKLRKDDLWKGSRAQATSMLATVQPTAKMGIGS
jgi:hypothetical protein